MVEVTAEGNRLIRRSVRHGGRWTLVLAAAAAIGAAAELALPAVLGLAVDAAVGGVSGRWTLLAGVLIIAIVGADALGDLAAGYGTARATARLRRHLSRHLLALDPRTAATRPVGDAIGRLVAQAADAGGAGATVVTGVVALLPPLGGVVALTLLDWRSGATFIAGLLLLTLALRSFVTDAAHAAAGYLRAQADIAGRLLEALTGARTIAAAGTVPREIDRVLAPLPRLREQGGRTWRALARAAARSASLAPLLQLAVVAVAGWSVAAGRLTPGQLLAAVQYAALGAGIGAVVSTLNQLIRVRAGADRVAAVLAEPTRRYGSAPLPDGGGRLTLRGVTVRADDGRVILERVDLDISPGTFLAVVGASGSGKSTLAAVAGRLYDPDEGEVRLDDVPLPRLSRAALHHAVGYGFERPHLVGGTVAEVLGLGPGPAPPSEVLRRAARDAAIADFIDRLPEGYRTRLSETPMSGGEAQRLGLARALRATRLLILDDATSSLDSATEHRIGRAVAAHGDGRTRLVVTHRAATAAAADLVAWLDRGRLRRLGRHEELWRDPAYRAVFRPEDPVTGGGPARAVGAVGGRGR